MKILLSVLLVTITLSFAACSVDPVENYANQLAKISCEGERTTDMSRKKELREVYRKLEKEIKVKYKDNIPDSMRLMGLYFAKLKDCLGYVPVH